MKRTISLILMMAILCSTLIAFSETAGGSLYEVGEFIGEQIKEGLFSTSSLDSEGLAYLFGQRMADGMIDRLSDLQAFKPEPFMFRDTFSWGMSKDQVLDLAKSLGWEYQLTENNNVYFSYNAKELIGTPELYYIMPISQYYGLVSIVCQVLVAPETSSSKTSLYSTNKSISEYLHEIIRIKYGQPITDYSDSPTQWVLPDKTTITIQPQLKNGQDLSVWIIYQSPLYQDANYLEGHNKNNITRITTSIF